jgi:hypothetical protein
MQETSTEELRRQIRDRREVLRRELELGEDRLRTLERETLAVQQTTLRISGAIQVLTELLDVAAADPARPETADHAQPVGR